MLDKLEDVERRYVDLEERLIDPSLTGGGKDFARLAKERAELEPIVATYRDWKTVTRDIEGHKQLLESGDSELRELVKSELPELRARAEALEQRLTILLLPKDPNDDRNVVLEIRAGTGGEEASLFAAELFRMYSRYAERQGWKVEVLSANATGLGGFKEVIALDRRAGRLQQAQVRERRAPRAARAGDRGVGPHPHLGGHRRRAARSRRGRGRHRRGTRAAHRRLPLVGARAGRASTPPTRPCASRTCRPAWWSPARTRSRSTRTRRRR